MGRQSLGQGLSLGRRPSDYCPVVSVGAMISPLGESQREEDYGLRGISVGGRDAMARALHKERQEI